MVSQDAVGNNRQARRDPLDGQPISDAASAREKG